MTIETDLGQRGSASLMSSEMASIVVTVAIRTTAIRSLPAESSDAAQGHFESAGDGITGGKSTSPRHWLLH